MELKEILGERIKAALTTDASAWVDSKVNEIQQSPQALITAFAATPRKTGKDVIDVDGHLTEKIDAARKGFTITNWSIDRLVRVWFLTNFPSGDRDTYIRTIENLFLTAEMNEQVALYSALPVLEYPESWRHRCTEGIRSNIGVVLESLMCENPYPSEQLDEAAWNQLVLKAIFTEKAVHKIIGLDTRANQNLANTLSDYAHERWAAGRDVNPLLWRCVGPFVDVKIFPDIEKIARSENFLEREAAALVVKYGSYPGLSDLPQKYPTLREQLASASTWDALASKLEA